MGHLAVIEGLDGSGKTTQVSALSSYYRDMGRDVLHLKFPNYEDESSALVRLYLSGAMGDAGNVNAYAASSFYAADRYISYITHWKSMYDAGHTIIADRYTTSNAVHQMCKLPERDWAGYLRWMEDYEYDKLGLPRPQVVIYLDMEPDISMALLKKRYRESGGNGDIHERDRKYLLSCREAALYACERLGWRKICCDDGHGPLPAPYVFERIRLLAMDV